MGVYLGIDFGTSTLCVTRWKENRNTVEIVPNIVRTDHIENGPIDNVIFYNRQEEHLIGSPALKRMELDPQCFVSGIKRELEGNGWQRLIHGQQKSAEDVATDIFAFIQKAVVEKSGDEEIEGVVVSIPFAFQHRERQKIKLAAQRANLPVLALIEEPVAAALSSGIFDSNKIKDGEKVLVFDFGGGTLDVTVFQKKSERDGTTVIEVITTDGSKHLGGKDIDQRITEKLIPLLKIDFTTLPAGRLMDTFRNTFRSEVENLKKDIAELGFGDFLLQDPWGGSYSEEISIDTFNEWIQPDFLVKVKEVLEDTLDDVELDVEDIHHIVLVGGSSRIPAVQELIEDFFGKKPMIPNNLEELVGLGAATYCGMLVSGKSPFKVIQKVSHGTGINDGGKMKIILPRNSTYGEWSELSYTVNKKSVAVYQGNSTILKNCSQIGTIDIEAKVPDYHNGVQFQLGTKENGSIWYRLYKDDALLVEEEVGDNE